MNKTVKKIIIAVVIIALVAGIGTGGYFGGKKIYENIRDTSTCDLTIEIDETMVQQDFFGWGTSNCWWADDIDDPQTREEIADLLFSEEGLNLDTFRYCIYAGYDEENNLVTNEWRLGESFLVYDEATGEYVYDWSRDANSWAMLQEALERGVENVVLFANSPHYSMTVNGRSSGNDFNNGYNSNINGSHYDEFVDYLITVTQHFVDEGVPVTYLSPINEPQWNWGSYPSQEGCHYEQIEAVGLFAALAEEIVDRNLDIKLCGLESGEISDTTKDYYTALMENPEIAQVMGVYSFHSYWSDSNLENKIQFGQWISENCTLPVEMSEWCELPNAHDSTSAQGACIMARVIANDINYIGVNSWSNWVAMNQLGVNEEDGLDYSDGLLIADPENTSDYYQSIRYFAYKQFSHFVPAGSKVLACDDGVYTEATYIVNEGTAQQETLSYELVNEVAFLTPEGDIVVVVVNEGPARNMTIKLDGYSTVEVFTTDDQYRCESTFTGEKIDDYQLGEYSINTFVFSK